MRIGGSFRIPQDQACAGALEKSGALWARGYRHAVSCVGSTLKRIMNISMNFGSKLLSLWIELAASEFTRDSTFTAC
jgi:hypothetical protein